MRPVNHALPVLSAAAAYATPTSVHELLEDAVERFNLIQQLSLTPQEKSDLVAFLRVL